MFTQGQRQDDILLIRARAAGIQDEITRLMKDLEQFSALVPSKGKKVDLMPQEEIDRMNANRLRKIENKRNKK